MKVNGIGNLFYGHRASGPSASKACLSSPLSVRAKNDQVTLSKQVLAAVQLQNRLRAIGQARENAENSPEAQALDSLKKTMELMKTCAKIAARIQAGDHVPLKDLRYLMKHDIRAYQMAMATRRPKEHPKEWKSAIPKGEEEEELPVARGAGQTVEGTAFSGCPGPSGLSSEGGTSIEAGPVTGGEGADVP